MQKLVLSQDTQSYVSMLKSDLQCFIDNNRYTSRPNKYRYYSSFDWMTFLSSFTLLIFGIAVASSSRVQLAASVCVCVCVCTHVNTYTNISSCGIHGDCAICEVFFSSSLNGKKCRVKLAGGQIN